MIREAASKVRFEWSRMAQQYLRQLYL